MASPFLPDDEKLAAIREELPATGAGIYLNTATAGPLPRQTVRLMTELADWDLRVGRAHPDWLDDLRQRMDEARAVIAAILRTDVDDIVLTHATTESLALALWSLDWQAGDRVLTTNLEHPGLLAGLAAVRASFDLELVRLDVGDGGDEGRTLEALERALSSTTRLMVISHVASSTGAVQPVERIAERVHARGIPVVVDGAQAAGAIPVDVKALGADFYAVPGQTWLLGPEGTGALYVEPGLIDRALAARKLADSPGFEWESYHRPSIAGLARSCGWLSMQVGLGWAAERAMRLARSAADRLAGTPGVTLVTPRERMATLVSFEVSGWTSAEVAEELGRRVFAIVEPVEAPNVVRLSIGFFNTEEEIGRVCDAVAEIAEHTPATLPRRAALSIIDTSGG